ncbi:MAG TPA: hypothetical protein VK561_10225, partial [Bradyrhizobium sp.]|nr:hypothetical protein [Bradyrhizobium sp.]
LFVVAMVVAASVVVVLVVTAFGLVVETVWANAAPDHATDPNNMAATAACVRARVNLIVSIFRSPKFYGASSKAFVPDIYWTRAARKYEVIMFLRRRSTATKQGSVASQ